MDDLAGKIVAGAAGGLLSSTITATVAYVVGLKQRRLTIQLAERKDLEDFVNDAAEYCADAERLIDITQEIHGDTTVTRQDVESLFKLHNVDTTPATPKLLQRATNRISAVTLEKQRVSVDKRRELVVAYKNLLFSPDPESAGVMELMRNLISDVHKTTSLAFQAFQEEIGRMIVPKIT